MTEQIGRSPSGRATGLRPQPATPSSQSSVPNAAFIDLAERCEKASGASRHLDTQVFILLDPDAQHIVGQKPGPFPQEPIYGPRSSFWEWALDESAEPPLLANVPAYTASLDAAMALAEGFGGQVTFFKDGTAKAFLWQPYPMAVEGKAATPALALTAAALRAASGIEARMAETEEKA